MMGYTRWSDVRSAYVERAGGEEAVEAGKRELLATVVGHRLAE
ncbi:transcriptional regulator, partial [Micromonospora sp. LOL_015]